MGNVSGTILSVTLDGTPFNTLGDADFTEVGNATENEMIPTSGDSILKKTRRVQSVTGVVLKCSDAERLLLQTFADKIDPFTITYKTASGSRRRCDGNIEFENRTTMENRATISLLPVNGWEDFVA